MWGWLLNTIEARIEQACVKQGKSARTKSGWGGGLNYYSAGGSRVGAGTTIERRHVRGMYTGDTAIWPRLGRCSRDMSEQRASGSAGAVWVISRSGDPLKEQGSKQIPCFHASFACWRIGTLGTHPWPRNTHKACQVPLDTKRARGPKTPPPVEGGFSTPQAADGPHPLFCSNSSIEQLSFWAIPKRKEAPAEGL
jgi:hypothetical protein